METNQNLQKRIDDLFKQNSKIPFMQAKEILQLGYMYGEADAKKSVNESKSTKQQTKPLVVKEEPEIGRTTKEMIEYANQKIKESENQLNIDKKQLKEKYEHNILLKVLEAQVKLSGEIANYINIHHNMLEIYDYIKELNNNFQHELYKIQTNYGEYKAKRR